MNVLLLSLGGGGGNILRSVKTLFRRDLAVTQKTNPRYADRLRRAVTTKFLDTNEFSLSDVPKEERLLIGANTTGRMGARHNPEVARQALEESRAEVEALLSRHSVIIVIGTGGKGTGAGTMFPVVHAARQQQKLVIPIFVRPSFERHEVDKRRFDHALDVIRHFDDAHIRLIEILNDNGYVESHPESQQVVWERMNLPIARGLRGLIYVLSDLSQVDPSDLSILFAGPGRLRIGFSEIDPQPSHDPTDEDVAQAVKNCWQNPYYAFVKPVATSLVCIQGDWSNVVDAKIKSGLAALAAGTTVDNPYNPLYARAMQSPRPWGVTALFAEDTGHHAPLKIDWSLEDRIAPLAGIHDGRVRSPQVGDVEPQVGEPVLEAGATPVHHAPSTGNVARRKAVPAQEEEMPRPATFWEFAVAVNRGSRAALALAADGTDRDVDIDGREVRKLLGTVWFRGVVPKLSETWRERILSALVEVTSIPNHVLKIDRRNVRLSELNLAQLKDLFAKTYVDDAVRPDLDLLLVVGRLWGEDALRRFQFTSARHNERSPLTTVLEGFRK